MSRRQRGHVQYCCGKHTGSPCIKRETHIDVMSRANSGQEGPFEGLLELAADLLSSPNDDRHLRAFKVDLNTHGPGMS
jgi:hypothetical protein